MPKPKRTHAARKEPAAALTPQQLIAIERERRAQICHAEIQALLKKHNCRLQGMATISGDKVSTQVAIVPLEAAEPPV